MYIRAERWVTVEVCLVHHLSHWHKESAPKNSWSLIWQNNPYKKVLLRERKRRTARRVALAISCYCGRMGGGGGVPWQKFFFQSEHVSSQIWCQKFFPLLRLGTPPPPLPGKSETWDAPPLPESVDRYTDRCQNITFPRTTYAGDNYIITCLIEQQQKHALLGPVYIKRQHQRKVNLMIDWCGKTLCQSTYNSL